MSFGTSHNDNDDEVLRAAKLFCNNDPDAFQWLHKRFSKSIYRFCLKMLSDEDLAKDAYQETFIKAYEHRMDFRGDNFPAWIFTIARRVCLNVIRSRRHDDVFDEILHSEGESSDEDVYLRMHIQKAIDSLSPEFKEALVLREYEGLSYEQIAVVLHIELSLAKVRVHRARLIVRKLLMPVMQERYES